MSSDVVAGMTPVADVSSRPTYAATSWTIVLTATLVPMPTCSPSKNAPAMVIRSKTSSAETFNDPATRIAPDSTDACVLLSMSATATDAENPKSVEPAPVCTTASE